MGLEKCANCSLLWIGAFAIVLSGCTKNKAPPDILNVDKTFSFPSGLPPDPGVAGKRTIEGIDADHDGLRDDVQRWIYARFPSDEKKRKALRQLAINYQEDLKKEYTDADLAGAEKQSSRAVTCLDEVFSENPEGGYNELHYVEAKVLNTPARTMRYLGNDSKFDGRVSDEYPSDGTACDK